jgi:hypothetical protein
MRRWLRASLVASIFAAMTVPLAGVGVARPAGGNEAPVEGDTIDIGPDVQARLVTSGLKPIVTTRKEGRPRVGDMRTWVGLDDVAGRFYTKDYVLAGRGKHSEVWLATGTRTFNGLTTTDLNFPDGDCRNGVRSTVTQAQVRYLINQFDDNIYPTESEAFSVPATRNGVNAPLAEALGLPANYYVGDRDDIAILVDNVRDDNLYDLNNTQGFSYIAGFFSSGLNGLFNRNVMTIDAFDWLHRTGANPPNEPVPGDNCASAPARPFLYEGVFAHEYQHLLESYEDPSETTWVNEGLSDIAAYITGYFDPSAPVTDVHFDSHTQCFLGFNGVQTPANPNPRPGGPENSLNVWGDQNADHEQEILCDYGAAFTMLLWLLDEYGLPFMTEMHRSDLSGFEGLQAQLDTVAPGTTVAEVIDLWQAAVALDGVLDDGATLTGGDPAAYQVDALDASINWDTEDAFDTPGAPPNGGDYVRLRDGAGEYLPAGAVSDITFEGASSLPALPITWEVAADPPGTPGDPALYSTDADGRNDVIVQTVTIPAGSPQLTFDAAWDLETTFDFAYAQITTDGGETYTSLACTDTQDDATNGNVGPGFGEGFNGFNDTPAFAPQTCDLSTYAGQTVALAFRYFSDSNTHGVGFWADDVAIDGTVISDGSTLDGWQSGTEFNPVEIEGYTVQLVAYDDAGTQAHVFSIPLDASFGGSLSGTALADAIGTTADVVSAIVTFHDTSADVTQYAPYTLTVNGVTQPGGS